MVASLSDNPAADANTDLPALPAESFGPTIVAASSAPGKRALHLVQNKVPPGLVWPQCGQAIVEFGLCNSLRIVSISDCESTPTRGYEQTRKQCKAESVLKNLDHIPACVFSFAALSVRSQLNSGSLRPKWP